MPLSPPAASRERPRPPAERALTDLWTVWDLQWDEIGHPIPGERERLADAVRTGNWGPYEALILAHGADDADLAGDLTSRLVRAHAGSPERLIAALDQMRAILTWRAALRGTPSERSLAITLESIGDGIITTDASGCVEWMNPVARRLSKWRLEDVRGRRLDDVFQILDEDTGHLLPSRTDDVLSLGVAVGLPRHAALVSQDGSHCPIADSMAPIRDEDGSVHGVVVVFRDLRAERACERALEANRVRTASILDASLDAVLVIDVDGVVIDTNAAAHQMFGATPLTGRRFQELLVTPRGHTVQVDVLARRREMRARRSDGTEFPVDIAIVRIPAEGIVSFTCFIRDLTDAKAAERALTESHGQLRSLARRIESCREEERTRIARELHDELGQQLTAIRMDIGWLERRLQGVPEVTERLNAMAAVVDSTFTMVRRLGTELRPGILDNLGLADAIEWQANEFEERSGIRVNVDTSRELGVLDPALSTAIFRIFQEILTNVGRHAGAKEVVGHLAVDDDQLTLEVRDDGRGIRPEEVANPTSLGLLGMRERATLLGGTFRIEAQPNGGTVVSVTLPRAEATPP